MYVARTTSLYVVLFLISAIANAQPTQSSQLPSKETSRQPATGATTIVSDSLEDPRLSVHVTVQNPQVYVGELLEELQTQTGIMLEMDSADTASGERIAVSLTNLTLREAMSALRSLLSYRDAPWYWTKEDVQTPTPRYVLHCSAAARKLPDRLKAMAQQALEAGVMEQLNAARLTDDELKKAIQAKRAPDWMNAPDGQWKKEGWRLFDRVLSPETQKNLLKRTESPLFAISDLPPLAKQFVETALRANYIGSRLVTDNGVAREVSPTHIRFKTDWEGVDPNPVLYVFIGDANGGSGQALIGGVPTHKKVVDNVLAQWLGKDDKQTDDREQTTLRSLNSLASVTEQTPLTRFACLSLIAKAHSLSFLMRCPTETPRFNVNIPNEATLGTFLGPPSGMYWDGKVVRMPLLNDFWQHKWHGTTLLLQSASWYSPVNYSEPVSWKQVSELRKAEEADASGFLPADLYLSLASTLKPEQIGGLSDEFMVFHQLAQGWLPLCQQFRRHPNMKERLFSKEGLPLASVREALLIFEAHGATADESKLARARVRLSVRDDPNLTGVNRMRALILWLLAEDGSVLGVQNIGYPNYQSRRFRNVPLPDSLRE